MFLSAPGQSFSVAVFIDPMLGDLGFQRTSFSGAYLFAGLCGGLVLPGVGYLLDRWGARRMLPLLGLLLGAACLWMSSIGDLAGLFIKPISFQAHRLGIDNTRLHTGNNKAPRIVGRSPKI